MVVDDSNLHFFAGLLEAGVELGWVLLLSLLFLETVLVFVVVLSPLIMGGPVSSCWLLNAPLVESLWSCKKAFATLACLPICTKSSQMSTLLKKKCVPPCCWERLYFISSKHQGSEHNILFLTNSLKIFSMQCDNFWNRWANSNKHALRWLA